MGSEEPDKQSTNEQNVWYAFYDLKSPIIKDFKYAYWNLTLHSILKQQTVWVNLTFLLRYTFTYLFSKGSNTDPDSSKWQKTHSKVIRIYN